ncbi:threonine ammonia-lyase [Siccirubricoccus deserti]|uniref:Threonine ammonia-lyase n=1 Tax=Siccirubricoccus deserti TaxID=2013562 RepID=A0A9X0QYD3_9PROT|nr:threonine ammonia-lyase [Siccirubricoccus deserti]MBC4014912.1 threonine ammonia-lyase [Siccirubricoccus deserti]GGC37144.1 threonine ammonia-lyase [Siccirubricoccus deserti]
MQLRTPVGAQAAPAAPVGLTEVRAAAARIQGSILRTPTVPSDAVSRVAGAQVFLKLDNLQATGAFKERGAANRIALLTAREKAAGVIAMSAGNHAQAVARHASLAGIAATIVMPRFTPATKVVRTEGWGARVVLHGETLAEAAAHAHELALAHGLTFIHPYDDSGVIAGQGTMVLEMLEDAPGLEALVFPVGGGGMLAGCAATARALRPGVAVFGVEVEGYPAMAQRLAGQPVAVGGPTIAEGIAVRDVGEVPLAMLQRLGIEVLVVPERAVEQAIALLAEGAKVVAEGAGAAGLAAILAFPEHFAGKAVGTVVCGGNIDARILANVLLRNLLRDGRILRLHLDIPDRPGVLADIATRVAAAGGNVIEVSHQRLFAAPSVQSAELELMIEVRDIAQGNAIVAALEAGDYVVRRG